MLPTEVRENKTQTLAEERKGKLKKRKEKRRRRLKKRKWKNNQGRCYEYTGEDEVDLGGGGDYRGSDGRAQRSDGQLCTYSLIGKFLTCRPFNRKAAITTLKRAWGLEEGVQMIEVGTNLFQLKFQTEFEMDRVFKGGPWSFDNQVLLLTHWKAGMTADNVRFDSVALWVQIWGTPFDLVSPKTAETVGSRLGSVVEVENKQKLDGQCYFMRVKVSIPIAKPIRRGAFLAGSDGKSHWVTFKYERLPLFCHFCGLLGHDFKHCASYFVAAKKDGDVICQYGDWLKATGARARSPPRRKFDRDDAGVKVDRQTDRTRQVSPETVNGDGGVTLQNPRE
ncbi:uncharacterized protein CFP56_002864 [Quercus suber]|uniref:DUF4283 domain-containing protein n=1 Tax=Quercus suber TaxID=58331 RepID=A0AAW0LDP2_QUESU